MTDQQDADRRVGPFGLKQVLPVGEPLMRLPGADADGAVDRADERDAGRDVQPFGHSGTVRG